MEKNKEKEEFGYVYVLENPVMPGLIKIGITKREDYHKRIDDLNRPTSVPVAFAEVHVSRVYASKCREIEKALHEAFSTERVNPRREFFRMDASRAIALLRVLELEDVTDTMKRETTEALQSIELEARTNAEMKAVALKEESRKKRPLLNFLDLGIRIGENIYWKDDESVFATISDERTVTFNGELCSLTAATRKILGRTDSLRPAPYWRFAGRLLSDLYNEAYPPADEE